MCKKWDWRLHFDPIYSEGRQIFWLSSFSHHYQLFCDPNDLLARQNFSRARNIRTGNTQLLLAIVKHKSYLYVRVVLIKCTAGLQIYFASTATTDTIILQTKIDCWHLHKLSQKISWKMNSLLKRFRNEYISDKITPIPVNVTYVHLLTRKITEVQFLKMMTLERELIWWVLATKFNLWMMTNAYCVQQSNEHSSVQANYYDTNDMRKWVFSSLWKLLMQK